MTSQLGRKGAVRPCVYQTDARGLFQNRLELMKVKSICWPIQILKSAAQTLKYVYLDIWGKDSAWNVLAPCIKI